MWLMGCPVMWRCTTEWLWQWATTSSSMESMAQIAVVSISMGTFDVISLITDLECHLLVLCWMKTSCKRS
jgi:hypothetical protein